MMMSETLGGQITLVHPLGAVLTRGATVLVHALGLTLPAAHAGTAGSQRRAADDRRHDDDK